MKLRHEINILNGTYSSTAASNDKAYVDPSVFNGTLTFYFEVLASNSTASALSAYLNLNGASIKSVTVAGSASTYSLYRSDSVTISSAGELTVNCTTGITLKAARLIIIQDTSSSNLIATETQVEIGNRETGKTNVSNAALTQPKYWKYDASKFDGSTNFEAEIVFQGSGSMYFQTLSLERTTDFSSWTSAAMIANGLTTSTLSRRLRASFTPVDGSYYRIAGWISNNMETYSIYNAKIIINQTCSPVDYFTAYNQDGTWWTTQPQSYLYAMGFQASSSYTMSAVSVRMQTYGTPTDNCIVEVLSGSPNGTVLASSTIAGNTIANTFSWVKFTLNTTLSLTSGTKYYIRMRRSSGVTSHGYQWSWATTAVGSFTAPTGYECWGYATGSTTATTSTGSALTFQIIGNTGEITKTQTQYLLANTGLAGGTSNQDFLTKWDSSEWDGVSNNYVHAVCSGNDATAVLDLRTTDGTQLANSTVTSPDNHGESTAYTNIDFYPTSAHQQGLQIYSARPAGGQTFTGNGTVLKAVRFYLSLSGTVAGTAVAKLYAMTGTYGSTGAPTGSVLATSDTVNLNTLTSASYTLTTFTFSGANQITLTNSSYYVVVIEPTFTTGGDINNCLLLSQQTTSPTHSGNRTFYSTSTSLWSSSSTGDVIFYALTNYDTVTMPSSQNIDVRVTANNFNLYASRLVVNVTKSVTVMAARAWGFIIGS